MTKIKAKIQLRRDTSANFTSKNPTLLLGECAFETDTMTVTESGSVSVKLKIGDGINPWSELPYTTFGFTAVNWDDISGKPTEFTPAPHEHEITDVIGLQTILDAIASSIPSIDGLATVTYVDQQDALKVDKVTGKGLSTEDYTTAEKTKLAGIEEGAEKNVNADWNATTGDAVILNKPTIPAPVTSVSKVDHDVKLGVAMTIGTPVYVPLAQDSGNNMTVLKASNASEATSSKTMGLIATGGALNDIVKVITEGLLEGVNTGSATKGDPVWLGVDGALIFGLANKPYAPAHLVFLGVVTRAQTNNGEIFVKVQNGFELKEIHDVDLITTTPINGHVLGFDGTLWVNKTIAGWLGFTPVTNSRIINTTAPLTGGGDLSANRTITIAQANATTDGYLSASDWNVFNNKFSLPTLTSGSVLFSNGTTIAQDDTNFFWDNTNKRLGIGTASPTLLLDVRSAAGITADARLFSDTNQFFTLSLSTSSLNGIRLYNNTNPFALGNDAGIQASNKRLSLGTISANDLCLATNAASRILINGTTGNVLIGTTTDAGYKLDVNGTARVKGVGTTTGVTLSVQNSASTNLLTVTDAGSLTITTSNFSSVVTNDANSFQVTGSIAAIRVGSSVSIAASAILQADSTTKGFLPPRMTSAQRTAIASPAVGLIAYQTDGVAGLYVNKSTGWTFVI